MDKTMEHTEKLSTLLENNRENKRKRKHGIMSACTE